MTTSRRWEPQVVLAQTNFFRELSEAHRRDLADLAIPRDAPRRAVLFREGAAGHSVYLLHRGAIRLHKRTRTRGTAVIRIVRPGEVFAEVILFEKGTYPVTATAIADSTVLLFPRADFRALLRQEAFRDDFLGMLLRRQRYLAERVARLSGADVEERLFHFLEEHLGDAAEADLPIAKRDVAAAIGTAPETLSRLLRRLDKEGRLAWKGRRVVRPA